MRFSQKLGITLLVIILSLFPARAYAATASDISKELICQCGCTLVLANCTHSGCMSGDTMTTLIEQKLAQGQSEEQIIQLFVAQYGEQVLASPPKRGFNLMAWVTPFAAILLGVGVIYIAIRKWVKRGQHAQNSVVTEVEERNEEYWNQLDKDLAEFTDRSFR